jgi:penicillin-binding protein 1A
VRLVRVNATTGRPAAPGERNVIWEAFKSETEIAAAGRRIGRGGKAPAGATSRPATSPAPPPALGTGTGGLY